MKNINKITQFTKKTILKSQEDMSIENAVQSKEKGLDIELTTAEQVKTKRS